MWVNVEGGPGQIKLSMDYTPKTVKLLDLNSMPLSEYIKVLYANDPQKLGRAGPVKGLHEMVSLKKKRFNDGKFDLDLAYITHRIIAMGFPSEGVESMYRNKMKDTQEFLAYYHSDNYKVYNLCSERSYAANKFAALGYYPFDDHNAPTLGQIINFCNDAEQVLDTEMNSVIAVHCKAGKGRTGTMICSLLCYKYNIPADLSMSFYADRRTYNNKGVTIPSQIRFVKYFDSIKHKARRGEYNPDRPLRLTELKILNLPENIRPKFFLSCKQTKQELEFRDCTKISKTRNVADCTFDLSGSKVVINLETKFSVYDITNATRPLFFFWIHTDFTKGNTWEAEANQLDKLANLEQYEGLKVILTFEAVPSTVVGFSTVPEVRKRTSNLPRGNPKLTSSDGKPRPPPKTNEFLRRSDSSNNPRTPQADAPQLPQQQTPQLPYQREQLKQQQQQQQLLQQQQQLQQQQAPPANDNILDWILQPIDEKASSPPEYRTLDERSSESSNSNSSYIAVSSPGLDSNQGGLHFNTTHNHCTS